MDQFTLTTNGWWRGPPHQITREARNTRWTNDANRQPMALRHEELTEVMAAWPVLSADLSQAILAIVRSADVMSKASLAATE